MMKNLGESLAGRVGIYELLGLSMREIEGDSFNRPFVPTLEYVKNRRPREIDYVDLWKFIHKGALHPIEVKKNSNPTVGDIKAFRLLKEDMGVRRGEGAVICTNDRVLPLTEQDNVLPSWYI